MLFYLTPYQTSHEIMQKETFDYALNVPCSQQKVFFLFSGYPSIYVIILSRFQRDGMIELSMSSLQSFVTHFFWTFFFLSFSFSLPFAFDRLKMNVRIECFYFWYPHEIKEAPTMLSFLLFSSQSTPPLSPSPTFSVNLISVAVIFLLN